MFLLNMKWRNLKIGLKFGAALLVTIVLFVVSMAVVFNLNARTSRDMDVLNQKDMESKAIDEFIQLILEQEVIISDFILFPGQKTFDDYKTKYDMVLKKSEAIGTIMNAYKYEKDYSVLKENSSYA